MTSSILCEQGYSFQSPAGSAVGGVVADKPRAPVRQAITINDPQIEQPKRWQVHVKGGGVGYCCRLANVLKTVFNLNAHQIMKIENDLSSNGIAFVAEYPDKDIAETKAKQANVAYDPCHRCFEKNPFIIEPAP